MKWLPALGLLACTDPAPPAERDAQPEDQQVDAQAVDAQLLDAQPEDQARDAARDARLALDRAIADALIDHRIADSSADAQPDDAARPDAAPPDMGCVPERCTGLDEDCDGRIDEGSACADTMIGHCALWLRWTDGQTGVSNTANSAGDARFHGLELSADFDGSDTLGIALRCGPDHAWFMQQCRVQLAHAAGSAADPVECVGDCAQTLANGDFAAFVLPNDVDGDDRLFIGLRCEDPALPHRATGVQTHVAAWVATQHRRRGEGDVCQDEDPHLNVAQWGFCPGLPLDDEGRHRCVASPADGTFRGFPIGTPEGIWPDLGHCDVLGIALTHRPD